ncbi:TraR/DksA family transcriptional regulator [Aliiroseovarius sp. YM-037]|uniref:TraR/DksA family transcriptional regulator n=1 Tax=Aliiroseovarius sp. YM-037 TaxID=3341728 RepID=UPI003A807889
MTTMETRREVLTKRLSELKNRLHEIEEELESHNSKDWEELAVEREEDEVLEGMGLSSQAEIRKIEAALGRIDAGEYGLCAKCGDKITNERLDVLPYTPFCKSCAV